MKDDTGAFIYPRNFRGSLLMRANGAEGLAITLLRGLPGTPMPSYRLPREDLWALAYYVRSLTERREAAAAPDEGGVRHIVLTGVADPGVWTEDRVEVGYRGRAAASPAQIVLREGEEVHLELRSADVTHAFYSPGLGIGPVEIYPGYLASFRFTAPGPGEYEYFCINMCGHCHFTMTGTIRVVSGDAEIRIDAPAHQCDDIHEAASSLPSDASPIDRGKALYRKRGCWTCHGDVGQGGVANVNALPTGQVPALDRLAESLMLWGPAKKEEGEAIASWLQKDKRDRPELADTDSFLRQYERVARSIQEGRVTPPKNPDGPEPPRQMPSMEARLTPKEVDAVMAYLIDLYDFDKLPSSIRQPISFDHRLHIEDLGVDCMNCHETVLEDQRSGIPANETCEGCHDPADLDESTSAELRKVLDHLKRQVEIPWKRIHDLPTHTAFSHSRHVTGGNVECVQCHGDLARHATPQPRPAFNLEMNWCVDCHEQREASLACRSCHP
jgi:heme/copper-type cytochrome/quinol oxidase subunit 2